MTTDISVVAESIETLCTVELRNQGPTYGVIRRLYESAREEQGGLPTQLAVEGLMRNVHAGDVVIIITGAYVPNYLPYGETDGPPGAASLAFALKVGLGAVPLILCEGEILGPVKASCQAIGLGVHPLNVVREIPYAVAVDAFPADDSAEEVTRTLLKTLEPKSVIAVEKVGPNHKGVAHTAMGLPLAVGRARAEVLISAARDSQILTIGIGDNGNEIGFGRIAEAVRKYKPYGRMCRCPCEGGLACATPSDVLITANVSNWGAYGLSACLAAALGMPYMIHDAPTELRMIDECVRAGAADGATGLYSPSVDGIPGRVDADFVEILGFLVQKSLVKGEERKF